MNARNFIQSASNEKIKNYISLEKANERKKQNRFIIEGEKEIKLAIEAGYTIHQLFVSEKYEHAIPRVGETFYVSDSVFKKMVVRENGSNWVAIAEKKNHTLSNLKLSKNPLIIVVEAAEKPGNIGAMLRTADAANADAFILCDPQTDFYNPNVIRSSVGCVFTVPLAIGSVPETIDWLKKNNVQIFCAHLEASDIYFKKNLTKPTAFVLGTEATGLSEQWSGVGEHIIIPMEGKNDSLNVSNTASILLFEAKRQRWALQQPLDYPNN